jgi:hypothetical protein
LLPAPQLRLLGWMRLAAQFRPADREWIQSLFDLTKDNKPSLTIQTEPNQIGESSSAENAAIIQTCKNDEETALHCSISSCSAY